MTASQGSATSPVVPRKRVPGYEDPAWDYGNPFGQVTMLPVRLRSDMPLNTSENEKAQDHSE
ncbi:hypothetical protein CVS30_16195 [Arthrobacter psychrolactophilus]|uniref:Uncharacterized protein n=1 Tax=Arthrobacter psychrolactophilus TaxID=92442 RepID=A0A2V5ISR5_9MICC|nr:hypothetical protein [Arthrobacter psychrolactophilus]PYI37264.1 hypothetical protein CVS30_16195 [Arthrobacter psychrolactophilus]